MKLVLLSRDLMFITRVKEVAASHQQEAVIARSEEALQSAVSDLMPEDRGVLLIDLEKCPLTLERTQELVGSLDLSRWRCISFYSHVHTDTAVEAKERGLGEVMPRSRFVMVLPQLFQS
jgi:hypothetical protein